ncbi:hypothetical protein IQ241_24135 [Romeria aff. gracilis LEGE 07310]|uniref:Uncharacterized protein n=1 Tax=Vasconcelosia minhoensis LEGE 07310 TaxID=915328 RepID=A0A8J7AK60_9CYAN|nr:hypothetical protein [Romeria gracilis]MBE9080339.1 hypothetical protein [Romeria aff. gracilis LEGE 07310]
MLLKRPLKPLAVLLLTGLLLSGCRLFNRGSGEVVGSVSSQALSDGGQLLENEAAQIRLAVPDAWESLTELRPDADIYAAHEADQLYIMVLAEDQGTLSLFDLADNAEQYRRFIASKLDDYDGETAVGEVQIDDKSGIQYEIRGSLDGTELTYLHTTLEGEDRYYQIIGWTKADRYPNSKARLQAVIETFQGT